MTVCESRPTTLQLTWNYYDILRKHINHFFETITRDLVAAVCYQRLNSVWPQNLAGLLLAYISSGVRAIAKLAAQVS